MAQSAAARDYSLVGPSSRAAVAAGLATAEWYHSDVSRKDMKALMQRRDGPAIRDTLMWFALLGLSAAGAIYFYGSWWAVPFFAVYGVLYGSASDSRWHECGHGTAFRTRWMNTVVYELASFMIMRESESYRWSHARHHTDTLIVGRDPDIVVKRPADILLHVASFVPVVGVYKAFRSMIRHSLGVVTPDENEFIPQMARRRVFWTARVWLALHLAVAALSVWMSSWLPVLLFGALPTLYGGWLSRYLDLTQHAGMAEDVLDHRLNSRTVYMNPVLGFIYWHMNYHVEHHMFPMVPYHALHKLHALIRHDTPEPYPSTIAAWREIIPAVLRQAYDPDHYVRRILPSSARPYRPELHNVAVMPQPAE